MTAVASTASHHVHVPWMATQPPPVAKKLRAAFCVSWERALRLFAAEVAAGSPTSEELSQRVTSLYFQGGRSAELCRWTRLFRAESVPLNTTQVAALAHVGEWREVVRQLHDAAATWHPVLAEEALLWAVSQQRWSDAEKVSRTFPVMESKAAMSGLPHRAQNLLHSSFDAAGDDLSSRRSDPALRSLAEACQAALRNHNRQRDAAVARFLLHRCTSAASSAWALAVSHCLEYAKVTSPAASMRLTAAAVQLMSVHTTSRELARLVQAVIPVGAPLWSVSSPVLRSLLRSSVRCSDGTTCAAVLDALTRNGSSRLGDVSLSLVSSAVRTCGAHERHESNGALGAAVASRIFDALRDRLDGPCRAVLGAVILRQEDLAQTSTLEQHPAPPTSTSPCGGRLLTSSGSDGAGSLASVTSLDAAATSCVRSGDWEAALALVSRIRDPRTQPQDEREVAIQSTLRAWRFDWRMSLQFLL